MAIYLQGNNGSIQLTAPKTTGGSVDLSNYYTKEQTDEKITDAVRNAEERVDFKLGSYALYTDLEEAIANIDIPEPDLTGLATESYVDENFVTKEDWETIIPTFITDIPEEYLTESEADELYAKAADIPDVSEFITEKDLPDTSQFVTATYVQTAINENAPDLSGYQTEAQVNTLISNALAEIGVAEEGAY